MANWITHTLLADELLRRLPGLDRTAFIVGNIAPDCNIENADWTAFTPSRETTHFMTGDKKTSADLAGFRARYLTGQPRLSPFERSFFLGYYSHLAADVLFMRFIRDEDRLENAFARIDRVPEMRRALQGLPHTLDTLKSVFGKGAVFSDIVRLERECLSRRTDPSYISLLPFVSDFPDVFDLLAPGAIARKIPIMLKNEAALPADGPLLFFTGEEYASFLRDAAGRIFGLIGEC